jgi:hypothetical protein
MRLIQTMLAFPAAGILGFGGHVLVRSALAHEATASAPERPGEATDEKQDLDEGGTQSPAPADDDAGRPAMSEAIHQFTNSPIHQFTNSPNWPVRLSRQKGPARLC